MGYNCENAVNSSSTEAGSDGIFWVIVARGRACLAEGAAHKARIGHLVLLARDLVLLENAMAREEDERAVLHHAPRITTLTKIRI